MINSWVGLRQDFKAWSFSSSFYKIIINEQLFFLWWIVRIRWDKEYKAFGTVIEEPYGECPIYMSCYIFKSEWHGKHSLLVLKLNFSIANIYLQTMASIFKQQRIYLPFRYSLKDSHPESNQQLPFGARHWQSNDCVFKSFILSIYEERWHKRTLTLPKWDAIIYCYIFHLC